MSTAETTTVTVGERLERIVSDIELTMHCRLETGVEEAYTLEGEDISRHWVRIKCWRKDVITGEMGWGYGGKGYVAPEQSDGQIVQMIFGLFVNYWTHEAREGFTWRGRRVFGPHNKITALWEAAGHVDIPSAMHKGE